MKKEVIEILLPTYQGEQYLKEQLDSILSQTDTNWKLIIRDDGSKDHTLDILEDYLNRYPNQISILKDTKGNLGVTNNVFELLFQSSANYVMFCDQDDVWFPNKIEISRKLMKLKERKFGNIPILIHTEAFVTNQNLQPINAGAQDKSYMNHLGYHKKMTSFANLLLLNSVQGATAIINKPLIEKLRLLRNKKIHPKTVHDSIIASVASIYGNIFFYNKPLLYYRQHDKNVVGVKQKTWRQWFGATKDEKTRIRNSSFLIVNRKKCDLLVRYYQKELTAEQMKVLKHYRETPNNIRQFFELELYREFPLRILLLMFIMKIE